MKNADKRAPLAIISSLLLLLTLSCERDYAFQRIERIEGEAWDLKDTVSLNFDIQDTAQPYNFYLKVRNNTEYPYRNIYFFLEMEFPNGRHWMDTVECVLADAKGNWEGSGIGNIKDHSFLFMQKRFPVKGAYRFHIVHAMRRERLKGIEDVGLGIERIGPDRR
jgi:gliding motility-associated lipoprotein GldH